MDVFEYAIKHGYKDLIQEAGPSALSTRPLQVLVVAQKEGLGELMDRAAEEVLATPLQDVSGTLSAEMFVIWVGSFLDINEKISFISTRYDTTTNGFKSCEKSERSYQALRAVCRNLLLGFKNFARFTETLLTVQAAFET